ncbi:RAP domain [Haematococcus lacustris]|uniref:RAP domain n=1 Tax=Haematococcus lacustris TaxID=44745 RepID=A0A699ZVN6_HAELA|nr:RAP domain [Haematococcus lacustris]
MQCPAPMGLMPCRGQQAWGVPPVAADILVTRLPSGQACQLVIEFHGPHHFLANLPDEVDGPTRLRQRMLQRRCQALLTVNWATWAALGTQEARQAWLTSRMAIVMALVGTPRAAPRAA